MRGESMTIKEFKIGQKAYVLNMNTGYNRDPEITETSVEKVGRKYVTIRNGIRYRKIEPENLYALIEDRDWGNRTFLCPSREMAEAHIERYNLCIWLRAVGNHGRKKFTLEQLRQVKAILEPEEDADAGIREDIAGD